MKYTYNCRNWYSKVSEILILLKSCLSQKCLKLQTGSPKYQKFWYFWNPWYSMLNILKISYRQSKVSEILILFKSLICEIYLKLQKLVFRSIRNSDTFEILCISKILKTADWQSKVSEILILFQPRICEICIKLQKLVVQTPRYQKFWYFWNPLYLKYT